MRRRSNHTGVILIILCSILFISGCANMPMRRSESDSEINGAPMGLAVASRLKFDDVPVPNGFRIIREDSFIFQDSSVRIGLIKYAGRPNVEDLVNFYKDQMPLYNWNLINIVEYGRAVINFEREDQTCIVTVEPYTTKTVLTIAIAPRSSRK